MYMQMINDLGLINEFLYSRATEIKCCWGLFLSKSTLLRLINIIGQIMVNIVLFLNNQYANILYFSDNNIYINIKQVILSRNWSRKLIWTSVVTQMKKQKVFSSRRSLAQGSLGFGSKGSEATGSSAYLSLENLFLSLNINTLDHHIMHRTFENQIIMQYK